MVALLCLLAIAGLLILGAPPLLRMRRWEVVHPGLALSLWLGVFIAGLSALVASLIWTVMLALTERTAALTAGGTIGLIAWVALATAGGAGAVIVTRSEPLSALRSLTQSRLEIVTSVLAYRRERVRGVTVHYIECDQPVAFSATHEGSHVVIASRLASALTAAELRAVIEHERAHLALRHGLLLTLASLNRACLPHFFGARAFEQSMQLLVELVADDAAARVCGPATVGAALRKTAALDPNEWTTLRAARLAGPGAGTLPRSPEGRREPATGG